MKFNKFDIAAWILGDKYPKDLPKMQAWAYDLFRYPTPNDRYEFTYMNAVILIAAMAERNMFPNLFFVAETQAWAFQADCGMTTHYSKTIPEAVQSAVLQLIEGEECK